MYQYEGGLLDRMALNNKPIKKVADRYIRKKVNYEYQSNRKWRSTSAH